nr:uncharacterized protein LOC112274327 isoform X1 [Physcomitrium patens]XP_024359498.1 uncharacterized protein LOC112274327 isoform X1 [Physcomitrium patens]|eukprot:XP_024359497.1 uncharacterized protein LOC112274327 isoform X1 [Physcomitrella patens]
MAKSHKSCIEMWFKNKRSNVCAVCHRISGCGKLGNDLAVAGNQYTEARNRAGADTELMLNPPMLITVMRRHPLALILWIGVLAFMTYLFVDAIKTNSIGYATVRIGFVYGILMIFWLGTILRWVLKYCQERRLWEMDMSPEAENPTMDCFTRKFHKPTEVTTGAPVL